MSPVFRVVVVLLAVFNSLHSFPLASSFLNQKATISTSNVRTEAPESLGNADKNGDFFERDKVVHSSQILEIKSGLVDESKRWLNNTIVYVLSDEFSTSEKKTIQASLNMIAEKTCITFKERSNEDNYLSIENSAEGCFSSVGMDRGKQILNLARNCVYKAIPAHELIHALGFYHEQSRTDRDDYVEINWKNIQEGKESNFMKYKANYIQPYGTHYDYGSLMHYGKRAFSKNPKVDKITPTQTGVEIGQRDAPSDIDIERINKMYKCL